MKDERRGELLCLLNSVFEGLFPVLALSPVALIGPLYTFAFCLAGSGLLLALILACRGEFRMLFKPDAQKDLLLTSVTWTLMFCLIFGSLRYTTAGNVAVLVFLQLLFAYVYFHVLGGQRLSRIHTVGACIMGLGALIILVPDDLRFNRGDILALMAGAVGPLANLSQKRARLKVSTVTLLTYRSLIALPILFAGAWLMDPPLSRDALVTALPLLGAIAVLVYVLAKILYMEALHRISIIKMTAMMAAIPVTTLFFAFILLGEIPGLRQLAGILPVLAGGLMITRPERQEALRTEAL